MLGALAVDSRFLDVVTLLLFKAGGLFFSKNKTQRFLAGERTKKSKKNELQNPGGSLKTVLNIVQ